MAGTILTGITITRVTTTTIAVETNCFVTTKETMVITIRKVIRATITIKIMGPD